MSSNYVKHNNQMLVLYLCMPIKKYQWQLTLFHMGVHLLLPRKSMLCWWWNLNKFPHLQFLLFIHTCMYPFLLWMRRVWMRPPPVCSSEGLYILRQMSNTIKIFCVNWQMLLSLRWKISMWSSNNRVKNSSIFARYLESYSVGWFLLSKCKHRSQTIAEILPEEVTTQTNHSILSSVQTYVALESAVLAATISRSWAAGPGTCVFSGRSGAGRWKRGGSGGHL